MRGKKHPQESSVTMTEIVLPNDTNVLNNLMGGRLMHWMDIASAIAAQKHSSCLVVTASADSISFNAPIRLGDVVTVMAKITRAFNTSMEVRVDVLAEGLPFRKAVESNTAYFTFVALDSKGLPVHVPEIEPETEEERKSYDEALRRRKLRLLLAKRTPQDVDKLLVLLETKEA